MLHYEKISRTKIGVKALGKSTSSLAFAAVSVGSLMTGGLTGLAASGTFAVASAWMAFNSKKDVSQYFKMLRNGETRTLIHTYHP